MMGINGFINGRIHPWQGTGNLDLGLGIDDDQHSGMIMYNESYNGDQLGFMVIDGD